MADSKTIPTKSIAINETDDCVQLVVERADGSVFNLAVLPGSPAAAALKAIAEHG